MNGDRYVSSFDETRSSLLSSSLFKVHHSLGRAHEQVMRVPERGVRLNDSSGWPRCRGDPVPGLPSLRTRDGHVKPLRERASKKPAAVEPRRLELLTSSLQRRCSTS